LIFDNDAINKGNDDDDFFNSTATTAESKNAKIYFTDVSEFNININARDFWHINE